MFVNFQYETSAILKLYCSKFWPSPEYEKKIVNNSTWFWIFFLIQRSWFWQVSRAINFHFVKKKVEILIYFDTSRLNLKNIYSVTNVKKIIKKVYNDPRYYWFVYVISGSSTNRQIKCKVDVASVKNIQIKTENKNYYLNHINRFFYCFGNFSHFLKYFICNVYCLWVNKFCICQKISTIFIKYFFHKILVKS